jgi:hypothetical protein
MKFLAIASAVFAATVSANNCDIALLTTQFAPILSEANTCQTVSGYTLVPPTALPTPEQLEKICSGCSDLVKKISDMTFPDCEIQFGAKPLSVKDLFTAVGGCSSISTPAASSTSAAPSSAPEVSKAPMESTAASTAGSVDDIVTDAPEVGTPEASDAPSPAPSKDSAAAVSAAGFAAVVASIAAVMAA